MSIQIDEEIAIGGGIEFLPDDIPGLLCWLDADDASTIIETGGDVFGWNDKSGNSNDARQETLAERPKTGVNDINGINAIAWDIFDDTMEFETSPVFDTFWATGGTLSFVSQSNSLGEDALGRFFDKQFTWRVNKKAGGTGTLAFTLAFSGTDATFELPDGAFPAPFNPSIVTITYDASSVANVPVIYLDGVVQSVITASTPTGTFSTNALFLRIGGRHDTDRSVDADYGEILFYDHILTDAERNGLHTYLSNAWSIALL